MLPDWSYVLDIVQRNTHVARRVGKFARAVVPNLGPPDVLGLQLPEILASRGSGEGFWEL